MTRWNQDVTKIALSVCACMLAVPLTGAAQEPEDGEEQQAQNQENENQARTGAARGEGSRESARSRQGQSEASAADDPGQDPYARSDDSWISISGTVEGVTADAFMLDYGDGAITVEMDDELRDAEAYVLQKGDKVSVNGLIDDDVFEVAKIEASSVYVEKLGTTFYSSAVDEEDTSAVVSMSVPVIVSGSTIQGIVTAVEDDEFTMNTGTRTISVEVEEMPYDPLDGDGYQKIEVGDHVSVRGYIDRDFFEGREFEARNIVTLVEELG